MDLSSESNPDKSLSHCRDFLLNPEIARSLAMSSTVNVVSSCREASRGWGHGDEEEIRSVNPGRPSPPLIIPRHRVGEGGDLGGNFSSPSAESLRGGLPDDWEVIGIT